jgi:hypothetical protein
MQTVYAQYTVCQGRSVICESGGCLQLQTHGRELPGKHVRISPGEYLVYHFSPKTSVRCAPNGDSLTSLNEMGYVFDELADAERYCQSKVNESPKIGCLIYDNRWKIVDRIVNAGYAEKLERGKSPERQLLWGTLSFVAGIALIWLDARHDWMLIIGFLVGARLAVGGLVKLVLAATSLRRPRTDSITSRIPRITTSGSSISTE